MNVNKKDSFNGKILIHVNKKDSFNGRILMNVNKKVHSIK
jgi:hypothetical protein